MLLLTPSSKMSANNSLCVPETRAPAHQRSDEKDIRSVHRRRKEATELLGFDLTPRTYGGRAGAAEDLGRDGQARVGKTSRVEGCLAAGEEAEQA
jgi:hypothetical protein